MTIAIDCTGCDSEVVFLIGEKTTRPRATCKECGQTYELNIRKVSTPYHE